MMNLAILDTDMVSEVFRQLNPVVLGHARQYERRHGRLATSEIVRFERRRDLVEKNAPIQLALFDLLISRAALFDVTRTVLDIATDLWVMAKKGGHSKGDADLIIAATALAAKRDLVTGNTRHFQWIPGLRLVNWRDP